MALYIGNDTSRRLTHPTQLLDALPPERRYQFKEGRSMAEAAKGWVAAGGRLPHSIAKVTGSDELLRAHFEYGTRVWGGGTGQTDVMAFVPDAVIAVEAKVDESFDQIVLDWICAEHRENPRSPPHRLGVIQRYADALAVSLRQLMELRYQLLQRTLCAALTAQGTWPAEGVDDRAVILPPGFGKLKPARFRALCKRCRLCSPVERDSCPTGLGAASGEPMPAVRGRHVASMR
jgi:hypothetical protein